MRLLLLINGGLLRLVSEALERRRSVLKDFITLLREYWSLLVVQKVFQGVQILKVKHSTTLIPILLIHNVFVEYFILCTVLSMYNLPLSFLSDFLHSQRIEHTAIFVLLSSRQLYGHCF